MCSYNIFFIPFLKKTLARILSILLVLKNQLWFVDPRYFLAFAYNPFFLILPNFLFCRTLHMFMLSSTLCSFFNPAFWLFQLKGPLCVLVYANAGKKKTHLKIPYDVSSQSQENNLS